MQKWEKCLIFAFEESPNQIIRNMHINRNRSSTMGRQRTFKFHATRPTLYGLETHLVTIHKIVNNFQPDVVILDPISNLINVGSQDESEIHAYKDNRLSKKHADNHIFYRTKIDGSY